VPLLCDLLVLLEDGQIENMVSRERSAPRSTTMTMIAR
jgi:hypothetical protein